MPHPSVYRLVAALQEFEEAHKRDPENYDLLKEINGISSKVEGLVSKVENAETPGARSSREAREQPPQDARVVDKGAGTAPDKQPKTFSEANDAAKAALAEAPA